MACSGVKCHSFLEKLDKLDKFQLNTGNVNAYTELKLKRFKSSADELASCLDLQLQSTPEAKDFENNGTLLLCDNAHIDSYDRGEIKITFKVFLSEFNPQQIREAVDCLKAQLKTKDIELLILSFPELEIVDGETDQEETKRWMNLIRPAWLFASQMVESEEISALGISDANYLQLAAMLEEFDIKPNVDHVRVDQCCAIPEELTELAKEHDIQLLVHNDPIPFPIRDAFQKICEMRDSSPVCCSRFENTWAARYVVWIRRRSVMASKGYIVQFVKKRC